MGQSWSGRIFAFLSVRTEEPVRETEPHGRRPQYVSHTPQVISQVASYALLVISPWTRNCHGV